MPPGLVEQLAPHLPRVRAWVALCDRAGLPAVQVDFLLCYEDLLAASSPQYDWPSFDENTAATLRYTSGATGNPKGVLYSHRSTVLHDTATGKLLKTELRAKYHGHLAVHG